VAVVSQRAGFHLIVNTAGWCNTEGVFCVQYMSYHGMRAINTSVKSRQKTEYVGFVVHNFKETL
jgi:hypothetical protein